MDVIFLKLLLVAAAPTSLDVEDVIDSVVAADDDEGGDQFEKNVEEETAISEETSGTPEYIGAYDAEVVELIESDAILVATGPVTTLIVEKETAVMLVMELVEAKGLQDESVGHDMYIGGDHMEELVELDGELGLSEVVLLAIGLATELGDITEILPVPMGSPIKVELTQVDGVAGGVSIELVDSTV